jgi:predicted ribosomally synthesized peptide with nif11-like leader
MTENMKRFVEEVGKDAALAEALGKVEKPEELIALAAKKDIVLTAEDLAPEEATGELSDEELEDVAGGAMLLLNPVISVLQRFRLWSPATSGTLFNQVKLGNTIYFGGKGGKPVSSGVYFGGIGGPVRLGDTDGGTVLTEV